MDSTLAKAIIPIDEITDMYLPGDNPTKGFFYPGRHVLPEPLHDLANALVSRVKAKNLQNCTISHMGMTFRCHVMPTANGDFYIYRRMPSRILSTKEIGLPGFVANNLLGSRLNKGGLVMVIGLPGSGKSTTVSSLVVDRLKRFGGICITIEDPIEMPLQGNHGEGLCLQRNVDTEEDFAVAIKDALRAYPAKTNAMMMIGEVRDPEAAALALRSSVDGRLVLFTMHAGSVVQGIQRLCTLAARATSMAEARELLASGFRAALHQKLVPNPDGGSKLRVSVLQDTMSVVGTIRQSSIGLISLENDLKQQANQIKLRVPLELRGD